MTLFLLASVRRARALAMLQRYVACPPIVKARFASNRLLGQPVPVRTWEIPLLWKFGEGNKPDGGIPALCQG